MYSQNSWLRSLRHTKGVTSERLTIVGKVEKSPIEPNENSDGSDNPEGRKANRRIEFRILKQ